jgi:hypothetical protein
MLSFPAFGLNEENTSLLYATHNFTPGISILQFQIPDNGFHLLPAQQAL